jgi:hypothetical protein
MRCTSWLVVLVFGALACISGTGDSARGEDSNDKGAVVELDGLSSQVPASWKEEAPSNQMRLAQFRLPKKDDDKYDAELVIFKGFGGSAKANIDRWKGMFTPPEGKSLDDVAKVEEIKIGGRDASYLDVHGTYLMKTRPFDPNDKGVKRPDYRMLAVHFDGPKTTYHIRLVGPARTVEAYKKGFDDWLKNFK